MAKFKASDILNRLKGIEDKVSDNFDENKDEKKNEEPAEQKFAEVTLADGETVLSYDGELAQGTPIFVVGEDGEQLPAPEGTHELGGDMAGTSIIVNAEGVIEEVVTEEAQSEDEAEEQMSSEDISAVVAETINKALEPILSQFAEVEKQNAEFKSEIEKLKEMPSEKKESKKKFNRDEDLTPRQRVILSRRKK